jgi:hypothetical protein
VYGLRWGIHCTFFVSGYSVFPVTFVDETILFLIVYSWNLSQKSLDRLCTPLFEKTFILTIAQTCTAKGTNNRMKRQCIECVNYILAYIHMYIYTHIYVNFSNTSVSQQEKKEPNSSPIKT